MKDIVQAMDVLAAGFLLFAIYSGLLSTHTGGNFLFGYLVLRFILKNAINNNISRKVMMYIIS